MKKLFAIAIVTSLVTSLGLSAFAQTAPVAPAPAPYVSAMSFQGKAAIESVKAGKVTSTIRLGDRTQAPSLHKVSQILPLVNSDKVEDPRSFEDKAKAANDGYVELTKVVVSQVTALTAAEQEELKKYYAQDKIDAAKGIVTVLGFKFKAK